MGQALLLTFCDLYGLTPMPGDAMKKMGVIGRKAPENIGVLGREKKDYLDWHRESILLR